MRKLFLASIEIDRHTSGVNRTETVLVVVTKTDMEVYLKHYSPSESYSTDLEKMAVLKTEQWVRKRTDWADTRVILLPTIDGIYDTDEKALVSETLIDENEYVTEHLEETYVAELSKCVSDLEFQSNAGFPIDKGNVKRISEIAEKLIDK